MSPLSCILLPISFINVHVSDISEAAEGERGEGHIIGGAARSESPASVPGAIMRDRSSSFSFYRFLYYPKGRREKNNKH